MVEAEEDAEDEAREVAGTVEAVLLLPTAVFEAEEYTLAVAEAGDEY